MEKNVGEHQSPMESPLQGILLKRGIALSQWGNYSRPEEMLEHDPMQMADMAQAVDLLQEHIQEGNKILVFGALMISVFSHFTCCYSTFSSVLH